MSQEKICKKCQKTKNISDFSGNRNFCKKCECFRQKEYQEQKLQNELKIKQEKENRPEYLQFIENYSNKIICGDALETMKKFPDECVSAIITSPPYNLNIRKFKKTDPATWKGKWNSSKLQGEGYDEHDDAMLEDEYIVWQQNILKECLRIIKDDGAIFYNHKWRVQNGLLQERREIIQGLPLRQIIIWKKSGGLNFNDNYYLPTYEIIYLICKDKFKLSNGANALGDVWEITQERGSWHPAPFPEMLVENALKGISGDLVIDPFAGSGTVPAVCKKNNKKYIGIDKSQNYCNKIEERLKLII